MSLGMSVEEELDMAFELFRRFENDEWTMANGNAIKLKDMETSHIENCLRKFKGKPGWGDWNKKLLKELKRREHER